MATDSSLLAWKIPWTEELGRLHTVRGVAKSRTPLSTHAQSKIKYYFLMAVIWNKTKVVVA